LIHKIDLLRAWLSYNNPSVITLSETWLNSDISDADVKLDGYTLYRADRATRGGGVATYISSHLSSELIMPKERAVYFECLFVNIVFHENKQISIGNIYRPPNSPVESTNCILATINSLDHVNELILLGDFNRNWLDRSSTYEKNLFNGLNLTQLITDPTRVVNKSKSLLDWILVTHPNRILQSGVLPDCFSDHSIVFCVWKIRLPSLPPKVIRIRQCNNLNSEAFIQDLISINWSRFQIIPYVEDAWNFFLSEVLKVIDKHSPWISVKVKGSHLPWIDGDLIHSFKLRDKAWAKYRLSKETADWSEYKKLRNACTTKTRNAKSNYYKHSLSHKNPKQFWKRLNSLINKTNTSPPSKLRVNNNIISDPTSMANAFNQHFSSICCSQSSELFYSNITNTLNNISFSFALIHPSDVQQAISEIKSSKGAGPDGLDIKFIKLASHVLAFPLCDLFNLSLSTCVIPVMWKFAKVIPLHKGGDSLDVNNYRPISIISNVAKIFEKLIFRQLSKYINDFSLLTPNQSGFRPNHSTTTALTKFTNDIFSAHDINKSTGAIFIDLSKAFDMVNHYILLDKLYAIGLSKSAVLWFNSYLHYRRQSVSFSTALSQPRIMETGVPQGSSLGPLLFSIFINELPQICLDSQIHLYADDTVIYTSNNDISKIQSSLQLDLNLIQTWFSSNLLLLNKKKTYNILFATRSALHKQNNSFQVKFLDGTPLMNVDKIKYLGLWLDSRLTFRPHIDFIVKNINCSLRMLYRSINCFTKQIRLKIINQ